MKIWFDFEFIENGKTIDPISIGMAREDGEVYYAEFLECDMNKASDWVKQNVFPYLDGGYAVKAKYIIAKEIKEFAYSHPQFWGYYCSYDWVLLCQIYGSMMDLPKGWPKWCRDVKQIMESTQTPKLLEPEDEHFALSDAKWIKDMYYECWNNHETKF